MSVREPRGGHKKSAGGRLVQEASGRSALGVGSAHVARSAGVAAGHLYAGERTPMVTQKAAVARFGRDCAADTTGTE